MDWSPENRESTLVCYSDTGKVIEAWTRSMVLGRRRSQGIFWSRISTSGATFQGMSPVAPSLLGL